MNKIKWTKNWNRYVGFIMERENNWDPIDKPIATIRLRDVYKQGRVLMALENLTGDLMEAEIVKARNWIDIEKSVQGRRALSRLKNLSEELYIINAMGNLSNRADIPKRK